MLELQYKQPTTLQPESGVTMVTYCAFCERSLPPFAQLCPTCNTNVGMLADADAPTQPSAQRHSRPIHLPELRLGGYRLSRPLGRGGMGIVYFAEKANGDCASIKILHPKFTQDRELVMRFLQEARLVQKVEHPNIIKLYNYGFDRDLGYFLTFEYLEGETLHKRTSQETILAPRFAADLVFQMLGGLSVAHTMNVIHCDLKPSNVFLAGFPNDPQVKLLDFGIAKSVAKDNVSITKTGVLLGTPEYMAPEQSFGRKQIDGRTDLYAVGVILFELLTGRRPFLARNASEMLVKHYRERPPIPSTLTPGLPPEMDELILACLEKDPRHRPQSAQELARWLRALYHLLPERPPLHIPASHDTEVIRER